MTVLVKRPRGTANALVEAEPAEGLLTAFLSGRSDCTRRAYGQDLEDFGRFLGVGKVSEAAHLLLSRGHGEANALALAWRASLQERRLQAATINRRLAALRSLVQLARTLGIVPWTLEVQNVRAESYRDTRGPGRRGVRLLYALGLRRSEVVALDLDDLDLDTSTVAVLGKGRTQKTSLTLPGPTKEAIQQWLEARGTEPGHRFATDAQVAAYAGVAPLEASSAGLVRHRLNRGGNRRLNAILYRIALTQAHHLDQARDYLDRRVAEGKTRRESIRALKRFIIRAIWRLWLKCNAQRTDVLVEFAA